MANSAIQVVEQIDGWEYSVDDVNGIIGIRKFIFVNFDKNPEYQDTTDLPDIGDVFEDTGTENINTDTAYENVFCRNIDIEPIGNDSSQFLFTCTYTNVATDKTQWYGGDPNVDNLPFSMDVGGEIELIEPPTSTGELTGWKWTLDQTGGIGNPVRQGIALRVPSAHIRIIRIMSDDDYATFKTYADKIKGRVNVSDFVLRGVSYGEQSLLFTYYTSDRFLNNFGLYNWKVDLLFVFRHPDWNMQINKMTSTWDRPYNTVPEPNPYTPNNKYTYGRVNFELLFTVNAGKEVTET